MLAAKAILLIIASEGYHPAEYGFTRQALENAGFMVEVASDKMGIASGKPSADHTAKCKEAACTKAYEDYPQFARVKVTKLVKDINPDDYAGVYLIGGPGAVEFLDNPTTYLILQSLTAKAKAMGAICISPRILAKAGLLEGKRVTGWDGDNKLAGILGQAKAHYVKQPVVVDGNLITGNGPEAAQQFGQAIVSYLKG